MIAALFRARAYVLAGLILLGLAAGWASRRLGFDFTPNYLFQSDDARYRTLERVQDAMGRRDNLIMVAVAAPDVVAPEVRDYVAGLTSKLRAIPGVTAVADLDRLFYIAPGAGLPTPLLDRSGPALRAAIRGLPLVYGRLVSEDFAVQLLPITVAPERFRYEDLAPVVAAVDAAIAAAAPSTRDETAPGASASERPRGCEPGGIHSRRAKGGACPPEFPMTVQVSGVPVARVRIVDRMGEDRLRFLPLCIVVFAILLYVCFRDPRAVAVPLAAVGLALVYLAGAMALGGEKINIINNVFPTLIFVVALSDAIHLIARYREELARGQPQGLALSITLRALAMACFLTSFTTAVGFGSLLTAEMSILVRFGLWAALGILIAYPVTVILLPLAFSFLRPLAAADLRRSERSARRAGLRLAAWVGARPRAVVAVGILLTAASAMLGLRLRVTNNLYEAFSRDDPLVQANALVERHFAGVVPFSVVAEWAEGTEVLTPAVLEELADLGARIAEDPLAGAPLSLAELAAEWNLVQGRGDPRARRPPPTAARCRQAVEETRAALRLAGAEDLVGLVYRPEARLLRIQLWTGDHGAHHLAAMFARTRALLDARAERHRQLGLEVFLSGDGYVASQAISRLTHDLFSSLLLAFVIIFVVFWIVQRSLKTALVAMLPNVLPFGVTVGYLGAMGMDLRLTSVLVFSISLGLAVDDTIHGLTRFREEWRGGRSYAAALRRTYRGVFKPMVTTTVVLTLGFLVLMTSHFAITRVFAQGMLVTLVAALAGDLLVLPAALAVFQPLGRSSFARLAQHRRR